MGKAGGKSRNDPAAVITILYSYKERQTGAGNAGAGG